MKTIDLLTKKWNVDKIFNYSIYVYVIFWVFLFGICLFKAI